MATLPDYHGDLKSTWPSARDVSGWELPGRFEGEVGDLIVYGEIPKAISGTFYRVMCDPFVPPHPNNVPIDGDGNISAFRIHNGRVDMKVKYIETERYKLERNANKALFGLYRNPFTHHPCVRAAVDSTANTNLIFWANKLLALKEVALPYSVDPNTLETLSYDPFEGQVKAKTFSAHPKVDPFTDELVVFGYEAKGLATRDVVVYALDKDGKVHDEQWLKSPWCAFIHDCGITPNWIILVLWPFEADAARMKEGKHHWTWDYDLPATFIVAPRRRRTKLPPGWKEGEYRVYPWQNCLPMHTGGAWEGTDGKLYLESNRIHDNGFPFFPSKDGRKASLSAKADYVCWEFDLNVPSGSKIPDPTVIFDFTCEFPRIDERFLTREYDNIFLNVFRPERDDGRINIKGLNSLVRHNKATGETSWFYAGDDCRVQEPVFIPRTPDAPEGDGWVIALVTRRPTNLSELVILDTQDFEKPIAFVQLPMHLRAQIHGNWVDNTILPASVSLVKALPEVEISQKGALEPL